MRDRNTESQLADRLSRAATASAVFFVALTCPVQTAAQVVASASSSDAITLTWTAPGDDGSSGTASSYDVRYSTSTITEQNWDAATQAAGEPAPQAAGSPETFTVENLAPNTRYYFAIRAADEVPNWSAMSNVATTTTDPEQDPPAALTDLLVASTTTTEAELNWTATGDDGSSGTASVYDIRYSTLPITEANWNAATQVTDEPIPGSSGSAESYTVTGLNPSTTYYFAINVADEVPNWSGLSNVVSTTTGAEQTPPAALADLEVAGATGTSVTLVWTATGDDGTTGTAATYDVRYSTSPISDVNFSSASQAAGEPAPQTAGSLETFTVEGLDSETTYYFAVKVADEVPNWSGLSNVVNATTPDETSPAAITNLQASAG